MAIIDVNFSEYGRSVRSSAASTSVLVARLIKAAPSDLTPEQRRILKQLQQRAAEVQSVTSERERVGPARLRPILAVYTAAWGGAYECLVAIAKMPPEAGPRGPRAAALMTSLFPEGVAFTNYDAETAWSNGARLLERIRDENHTEVLHDLIGGDFLHNLEKATAKLADAIGVGRAPRTKPSTTALSEALARFGRTVGLYGRSLAAQCDEERPESVERFLRAVEPIDVHRAGMRSGTDRSEDEELETETPSTPPPAVVMPTRPGTPTSNGIPSPEPVAVDGERVVAPTRPGTGTPTSNGTPAPVDPPANDGTRVVMPTRGVVA